MCICVCKRAEIEQLYAQVPRFYTRLMRCVSINRVNWTDSPIIHANDRKLLYACPKHDRKGGFHMNMSDLRVLDMNESFWLLVISCMIITFVLLKVLKGRQRRFIPLIVSLYGCAFCASIIFVFGEGFTGIAYVLLSWVFLIIAAVSLLMQSVQYVKAAKGNRDAA